MSAQRPTTNRRRALWEANDQACAHCGEKVRWHFLHIDHLIPEHLHGKPELEEVLAAYSLPADFDLESDLNLVPSCAPCNSKKRQLILGITSVLLAHASKRAESVPRLIEQYLKEKKADDLLPEISSALECNIITTSDLRSIIEAPGYVDPARAEQIHSGAHHEELIRLFGNASSALLNWPQETGGRWLDRHELLDLENLLDTGRSTFAVLLGEPGCGKSALLAKLGTKLREGNVCLLALKADLLPKSIQTLADLDGYLGVPSLIESLRELTQEGPVVLLLDQVDALSELMDQHTSRLTVLLSLIHQVRNIDDIHIILSCREFEFRHDVRLSLLSPSPIRLSDPPWADVSQLLLDRSIDSRQWHADTRELLRRPQHLSLFVEHLADGSNPTFVTCHGMLQELLTVRVLRQPWGAAAIRTAEELASQMAEEEELWVPAAPLENRCQIDLDHLIAAGFLRYADGNLRIGFSHQTIFDFIRARAFTSRVTRLSDHVLARQDALFVRPTLWSTLHYMRAADPRAYSREFDALWQNTSLRPHVRYLLIEFIGRIEDPTSREISIVVSVLGDASLRAKAFRALEGRAGWFQALKAHLPVLMEGDATAAWHASWILRRALEFATNEALDLIQKLWMGDSQRDRLTLHTFWEFKRWDEESVGIIESVCRRTQNDMVRHVLDSISEARPDLAPRVVAADLSGAVEAIETEPQPEIPTDRDDDSLVDSMKRLVQRPERKIERLLDSSERWYGLAKVARAAPEEFFLQVWPWLEKISARYVRELHRCCTYHPDSIIHLAKDQETFGSEFPEALSSATEGFAKNHPERFVAFREHNKHHSIMSLHRVLMLGSSYLPAAEAERTLQYLAADPRNLAVGPRSNVHQETNAVIRAIAEHLSPASLTALEMLIKDWRHYERDPDATPEERRDRLRWNREHRLRLLRALPANAVSEATRRLLEQESRALPHTKDWDFWSGEAQMIGSPVKADQMIRATNADLLNLFDDLSDDTGHHHPRDLDRGGGAQASQAFGELAKKDPERALSLFSKLQPEKHERYAGEALRALADAASKPDAELINAIHDFEARGFHSGLFRESAALALQTIAVRNKGLDERTCALLESWLSDSSSANDDAPDEPEKEAPQSILLDRSIEFLPHGNYPILRAIFCGYLCREPSEPDSWLAVLERHATRRERLAVWIALAGHELIHLARADAARSAPA